MMSRVDRPPLTLADRYQLLEIVGRGGMGEVWSAKDLRLDRHVAVKMLNMQMASEVGVRERFDIEARSAARLNHPSVVSVYDSGEHDGVPYLIMELLPGRTMADEMVLGPLEAERARQLGTEMLAALSASHEAGILHRDIKPANVLLTADGTAKVSDFGIAKSTEGLHLTSTGIIVGTAAYLAPERVSGRPATPQSDLYAVGVVLYEALSGRKPFDADTPLGILRAVEAHEVPSLARIRPGLDASLVATVERAMDKDPARRFVSAADMAVSLRAAGSPAISDDRTLADSAAGPTQALPGPTSTQVLSTPTGDRQADVGRSGANPPVATRWSALRNRAGVVAILAIMAIFVVVVLIGTRRGSSPTPAPTTVAPSTPTTALPTGLDEALKHLQDAVRP